MDRKVSLIVQLTIAGVIILGLGVKIIIPSYRAMNSANRLLSELRRGKLFIHV